MSHILQLQWTLRTTQAFTPLAVIGRLG